MKHEHCPVCNKENLKSLNGYERAYLVRCGHCDFVFSSEIPESRDLEAHYAQYGRNDYLSPVTIGRYEEWLGDFSKLTSGRKILDIGCGIGFLLETAKRVGWNVTGTEYSEDAIEICKNKGIEMFRGDLSEINFNGAKFDVITAIEVIEHLSHPGKFVQAIKGLLNPDGVLFTTTPNFASFNRRSLGSQWNVIAYPEHLSYFDKKSMDVLLSDAGFAKISLRTTGISLDRFSSSINKKSVDHSSSERTDEKLRRATESNFLLKMAKTSVNAFLNQTGLGESLSACYVLS